MSLFELAKNELTRSNADARHPFKNMVFATQGDYPELRTVVKRRFESDLSLLFYTDSRTLKVAQIQSNPLVGALFYHPKKKLQVRYSGTAEIIDETHTAYPALLQKIKSSHSKSDYMSLLPPGTPVNDNTIASGDEIHFVGIKVIPTFIDILQLSKEGHQRSRIVSQNNEWREEQIVP